MYFVFFVFFGAITRGFHHRKKANICGFSLKVRHQIVVNNKYFLESFHMADYIFQKPMILFMSISEILIFLT